MRMFLTGGAGFVGRHLIGALRSAGHEVVALAISDEEAEVVSQAGAVPVLGDVDDKRVLQEGMQGCEVVFHIAAKLGLWGKFRDFYRVNVEGTRNVLEAARAAGAQRLVHVSAAAVVADQRGIIDADEMTPMPRRPLGVYARTKAMAEAMVLQANCDDFTTVAVRPPAIWGKGESALLTGMAERVRRGKYFWIDHGRYPYETCHVTNVCEGLLLAAERGRGGQAYFLTDGPAIEFREFATALLQTQGLKPGDKSIPRWLAWLVALGVELVWKTLRLTRDPPITRTLLSLVGSPLTISDDKARAELGYQASISREEGYEELTASDQDGGVSRPSTPCQ